AVDIAAHILVDHFTMMFSNDFAKVETPAVEIVSEEMVPVPADGESEIETTTLSTRAKNALVKNGILSLDSLRALDNDQISNLGGLGDKTIKEIQEFLGR